MKIPSHAEVITAIEDFLAKTGMKAHDFGKEYLNDSGAVPRLKRGVDPRLSTVIKIADAITEKP